jgi:hypothetical protein
MISILEWNKDEIKAFIDLHRYKIALIIAPIVLVLLGQVFGWGSFLLVLGLAGLYYIFRFIKREIDHY